MQRREFHFQAMAALNATRCTFDEAAKSIGDAVRGANIGLPNLEEAAINAAAHFQQQPSAKDLQNSMDALNAVFNSINEQPKRPIATKQNRFDQRPAAGSRKTSRRRRRSR